MSREEDWKNDYSADLEAQQWRRCISLGFNFRLALQPIVRHKNGQEDQMIEHGLLLNLLNSGLSSLSRKCSSLYLFIARPLNIRVNVSNLLSGVLSEPS